MILTHPGLAILVVTVLIVLAVEAGTIIDLMTDKENKD